MSKHGKRLVSGVRELLRTEGTILEDLHMVATDVVLAIDKIATKALRKLKRGQRIRCYDEDSNKEYGQKGSDMECFFGETHNTKTRGMVLRIYTKKQPKEWVVPLDYLLEIYEDFDPESDEGKKQTEIAARPKRRGRKPKQADQQIDSLDEESQRDSWSQSPMSEYEQETEGEEYDFTNFPEEEFDDYE